MKYFFLLIILYNTNLVLVTAQKIIPAKDESLTNVEGPVLIFDSIEVNVGDTLSLGLKLEYWCIENEQRHLPYRNKSSYTGVIKGFFISKNQNKSFYYAITEINQELVYINIKKAVETRDIVALNGKNFKNNSSEAKLTSQTKNDLDGEAIYEMLYSSVITVTTNTGGGSGVIVSSDGYFLTNCHVVKGYDQVSVFNASFNQSNLSAKVIFCDEVNDIAICKLNSSLKFNPVELGHGEYSHRPGSTIYLIGSPGGYTNLISKGIISGFFINDKETEQNYFIYDASSGSGASGGALVNSAGKLIGINVSSIIATKNNPVIQNINFAISIGTIIRIIKRNNFKNILEEFKTKKSMITPDSY